LKQSIEATLNNATDVETRVGWIANDLRPSLLAFFQTDGDERTGDIEHLRLTAAQSGKIVRFRLDALPSYVLNGTNLAPAPVKPQYKTYVHSDYEHLFDFFDEILYHRKDVAGKYDPGLFQRDNSVEGFLFSDDDIVSGKAVLDLVKKITFDRDYWD
jgi:hypothetical protein